MKPTMGQAGPPRQGPEKAAFDQQIRCSPMWLTILHFLGLLSVGDFQIHWCIMRSLTALLAGAILISAGAASAETHIYIIVNHADGYGVDQCLARGDKCGAHAALSYCRSRDFAQALSYHRVEPEEITGSVPKNATNCRRGGCDEYVAITCQR